jgi:transposase
MAKRTFRLNGQQSSELWQAYYDASQPQEQRRLQAVRLYGEGWTVAAIQQATGCSAPSLMRWVADYRRAGVAGLSWRVQGGNRARLSVEQRTAIQQKIQQYRPDQVLGSQERQHSHPFWTVEDLRVLVEKDYGVRWNSRTSYRTLLAEAGFSVQRVSSQYRSRPSLMQVAEAEALLEKK